MDGTRCVWVPKHKSGAPLTHLGYSCIVTSHSRRCHLQTTSEWVQLCTGIQDICVHNKIYKDIFSLFVTS
jgi:hypothetical protein